MDFDLENPLISFTDHQYGTVKRLFASESDHMPSTNLLQSDFYLSFRREAISLVQQAQQLCAYDHSVPYLAVNYLDRFISTQEIRQGKPWVLRVIAISCLSLAAKMTNTDFSITKFQSDEEFIIDARTINRMELLILDVLNWRMRSITPFSFLCFFISLLEVEDQRTTQILKDRASEIILKAQNEVELLEFKPSILAASALLVASHELFPSQFPSFKSSISSSRCARKVIKSNLCALVYFAYVGFDIHGNDIGHAAQVLYCGARNATLRS